MSMAFDPTGLVWARQNNDGNSTLATINPISNATQFFTYGNTYTNVANRGFDDVQFSNGATFLSETNPASPSDSILLELTNSLASPPLQLKGLLAAGAITDPDSLILLPNGDLALTGEADQTIVFIHNPGTAGQTVSYLPLLGVGSGLPDDTAFRNSTQGLFFYADTGANLIYEVSGFRTCAGLRIYRRRKRIRQSQYEHWQKKRPALRQTPIELTRPFSRKHEHGSGLLFPRSLSRLDCSSVYVQGAVIAVLLAIAESPRMNADDCLSLDPLGRVEGGDGIVEDSHVADVCPQPTIPDPLDDLTQLGAIGYDEEVDSQAASGPCIGRADRKSVV